MAVKYKQENVLDPCILKKEDFLDLESTILNNIENPTTFIYNIFGNIESFDIGPEKCMEYFLEHEEFFNLLEDVGEFSITINYLDKDHDIYLRLCESNIILNVKGSDNVWVEGKLGEIINFLNKRGLNYTRIRNPGMTREHMELMTAPIQRGIARAKKEEKIKKAKNGFIFLIVILVSLTILVFSVYYTFYRF